MWHVKDRSAIFFWFVLEESRLTVFPTGKPDMVCMGATDGFAFMKPELSWGVAFRATVSREGNSARNSERNDVWQDDY